MGSDPPPLSGPSDLICLKSYVFFCFIFDLQTDCFEIAKVGITFLIYTYFLYTDMFFQELLHSWSFASLLQNTYRNVTWGDVSPIKEIRKTRSRKEKFVFTYLLIITDTLVWMATMQLIHVGSRIDSPLSSHFTAEFALYQKVVDQILFCYSLLKQKFAKNSVCILNPESTVPELDFL